MAPQMRPDLLRTWFHHSHVGCARWFRVPVAVDHARGKLKASVSRFTENPR